ncbi:MAG: nucleotidyltransferase family protein [Acidimicrobiales bacterium]
MRNGGERGGATRTVAGVVLAAGGGSRYRGPTPKLLAPHRGRSVVSWAIDAARGAGLDEVVVVSGSVELSGVIPDDVTVIENSLWAQGQATSVGVALEWCRHQGHEVAVVGLGDQPGITSSAWAALAQADGPITVATYGGRRGNPVRLHRSVWELVPRFGDEGARRLMRDRPELVSELACEGNPSDIDTVEDLDIWN